MLFETGLKAIAMDALCWFVGRCMDIAVNVSLAGRYSYENDPMKYYCDVKGDADDLGEANTMTEDERIRGERVIREMEEQKQKLWYKPSGSICDHSVTVNGVCQFIQGLLKELPSEGSDWSTQDRVKWLRAAALIFDLIYKNAGGEQVKIEADSAK